MSNYNNNSNNKNNCTILPLLFTKKHPTWIQRPVGQSLRSRISPQLRSRLASSVPEFVCPAVRSLLGTACFRYSSSEPGTEYSSLKRYNQDNEINWQSGSWLYVVMLVMLGKWLSYSFGKKIVIADGKNSGNGMSSLCNGKRVCKS